MLSIVAADETDSTANLMADLNGSANNDDSKSETTSEDSNPQPVTKTESVQPPTITQNLPVTKVPASPKPSKPMPVPSNPLEAAMFKQMFPEEPKKVVKKSLAAMQAETGVKAPSTSPSVTRRDSSSAENGSSGKYNCQQQVTVIVIISHHIVGLVNIIFILL